MQRWWSLLFGVVLAASLGLFIAAPFVRGWWLPQNVASFGAEIDYLYYIILGFTGFFFVLTEAILVYVMFRFPYRPGHKAVYVEGNHRLEIAWTIVPAVILLFIAFAQVRAWETIKYNSRFPEPEQIIEVTAHQWEWRLRHPEKLDDYVVQPGESPEVVQARHAAARRWGETRGEISDLHLSNDLHVWKGGKVKIYLKTQDVLHSFFIPNLRLKQDALPGKTIPMWFEATDSNCRFNKDTGATEVDPGKEWEIACAELCGGGHYRMRGRLYVHRDRADYDEWLKAAWAAQHSHKAPPQSSE